ncbi:putative TPR domain protein [Treponema primitia ZAS-2]|uniref:Putative TPR domain protein n=1 Tax=Treponema primitia (strain ATCC BAA-887 / DSM 12427 / ZAS-2) TaxID=545694 RepID=F5YHW9_TREPZ|nr:tetratricopeptide repeat protein [Treponema primitia]AEF86640.1 putative TPR domain protein [Treponema primitia ZAS-2]
MATTEERKEKLSFGDALADFIQNNRKALICILAAAIVIVLGSIAGFSIRDSLRGKAISQVEDLSQRYDVLVIDINNPSKEADVEALLDELTSFAGKHSGYPGARAYYLIASIYTEKKDWVQAEEAWSKSAKVGKKIYLAPVALYNAAVAAEEQGNLSRAISLYLESAAFDADFPDAPRAQFAVGRLYETQGDIPAALEAYRVIPEKWEAASTWINLAQSRIIFLEGNNS